jgi:hypothetical protein
MKAPFTEPKPAPDTPTHGAYRELRGGDYWGDGYDWMEKLDGTGWRALPNWGRDGWDLGDWPLVVIAHAHDTDNGDYLLAERVEGDVTVWAYHTKDERDTGTDRSARYWWSRDPERHGEAMVEALANTPEGELLDRRFRGPFSWARLDAEKEGASDY